MGWTIDQKKAIDTDTGSGNLLVSAAAGSGKTAVLVERVLEKILNGKSTVDRLLIVTFTEAAASEMRQKIIKRLAEYIQSAVSDEGHKNLIKEQLRLAQTADIMTIDGFCSKVVLNNFHTLGIDPNIQICDDAMSVFLSKEAIATLFNRIYKSDDADIKSRFKRLTDYYAKDRNNDALAELVMAIYRFTEPFADPAEWLDNSVREFSLPVYEQSWARYQFDISKATAGLALRELSKLDTDNDTVLLVQSVAQRICDADNRDSIYDVYNEFFSKPKKRAEFLSLADSVAEDAKDTVEFVSHLLCDLFSGSSTDKMPLGVTASSDTLENTVNSDVLGMEASDLVWLVKEFIKEYTAIKERRNLYEFSDIEHLTYRLFTENESVRNEYRNKYDEILIDEYQDTNMLQDKIFESISHKNIFMVGDLKQSIYRFRKGDPYIFKAKAHSYEKDDTTDNRIILSQNFRSRKEVLDSVNDIFTKIMSETAGDVDYTDGELIVRDNEYEYYPPSKTDLRSELHYLAIEKNSDIDRDVYEAYYTANKINELLNSGIEVFDKATGAMRPIMKKDIVILENSVKYNSEIITDELSKLGIASYVDKSSFFDRREISLMLSLISVIDNSHNDIPLISVMRSPIGGFSDEDLATIRIHTKKFSYFIDTVSAYANDGEDTRLRAHCGGFLSNLRRWRDYTRKKSVAQLIWAIYEETCFYDMMGAIEEGEEAQTNLRLLYERAKQYETAGFRGLFNFITYINQLSQSKNDLEGAKLVGENHDVVRIMTIHKSKGLEFPYVFLLGAGRDFPVKQDTSVIRMHKQFGFGLPHINYEKHYSQKTPAFELITKINKHEGISERMRLLYVALTRPREKLYVVVSRYHDSEDTKETVINSWCESFTGNKFLPSSALSAKGFYSWLCPAGYMSPDTWKIYYNHIGSMPDSGDTESIAEDLYTDSMDLRESVYEILDYKYPYAESDAIPSRTSVTQLKELAVTETEYEPDSRRTSGIDDIAELMFSPLHTKPKFLLESTEKPANEIGTLYHLIMSVIDIKSVAENGPEYAKKELERLVAEDIVPENDMKYIDADKIVSFFKTGLAIRMSKSENINRERAFQINIPASEYDPSLSDASKDEKIILQGIIDCFFEEDDGFVLFDYKTDKVKNGSKEIKEKYKKQLELYSRAIEELMEKPVKETYLYLFDTNEVV